MDESNMALLIDSASHRLVRRVIQEESEVAYAIFNTMPGEYTPEEWRAVLAKLDQDPRTVGQFFEGVENGS